MAVSPRDCWKLETAPIEHSGVLAKRVWAKSTTFVALTLTPAAEWL
jgi:hypothetical protein